jgi:hypothetical protein
LPLALHVCTPLPEHRVVLGAQTPLQPPATQAWLPQSSGAPHWPVVPHISTALPAHRVAPEEHAAPPSDEPSTPASGVASSDGPTSGPAPTASAMVASGTSETVESSGPASVEVPPLLLPEGPSSLASGPPLMVVEVLPPQETTTLPASTPVRAHRIQDLESIMRPLEGGLHHPNGESRSRVASLNRTTFTYLAAPWLPRPPHRALGIFAGD